MDSKKIKQVRMMFWKQCTNCGKALKKGNFFCPYCGISDPLKPRQDKINRDLATKEDVIKKIKNISRDHKDLKVLENLDKKDLLDLYDEMKKKKKRSCDL